jgi:hypothetical protein
MITEGGQSDVTSIAVAAEDRIYGRIEILSASSRCLICSAGSGRSAAT